MKSNEKLDGNKNFHPITEIVPEEESKNESYWENQHGSIEMNPNNRLRSKDTINTNSDKQ